MFAITEKSEKKTEFFYSSGQGLECLKQIEILKSQRLTTNYETYTKNKIWAIHCVLAFLEAGSFPVSSDEHSVTIRLGGGLLEGEP